MNKKYVVVQGFGIYITMVGACYAAPPPFVVETDPNNPLAVQTVEGNPLEVTVVNTEGPAVSIPSQGVEVCSINPGQVSCRVEFILGDSYPDGTNTFVFQTLNVKQEVDTAGTGAKYMLETAAQRTHMPIFQTTTDDSWGCCGPAKTRLDNVTIYHDGTAFSPGAYVPVRVTFEVQVSPAKQNNMWVAYTGYYTWFPQP